METYQEFLDRINSFEKRELNYGNKLFKGNPSISQKVGKDNVFRNFYGDTIVFALDDIVKEKLAGYVELLYQSAPECFCERLVPHTFHVTLHDLSNAPVLRDVAEELFENELKVIEKMGEIQKQEKEIIKMKSKYIFNMVDTSLVLGLYPVNEGEYRRLMDLYSLFDTVKKLSYPFTPHITLAYYNIDGFDLQAARRLEDAVNKLNKNEIEIELNVNHLYYQKFRSMNDYIDIINLGKTNK
ncbi:MAG: 2'-5' RNA ligase family protein [Lachnospiraceae bacterium]|nr:2'-5' RNA ligase family protein [Lachnospiraceae bacterium]